MKRLTKTELFAFGCAALFAALVTSCSANISTVNNSKKVVCTPSTKGVQNGVCDVMIVDGVEFSAAPTNTTTTDASGSTAGFIPRAQEQKG